VKAWWRRVRPNLLPPVLLFPLRLLVRTLRLTIVNGHVLEEVEHPRIFWAWHGRLAIPGIWYSRKQAYALISPSRDGEILARMFDRLGYRTIRGSTRRGGIEAAIEGVKVLQAGNEIVMTPDGPRGPNRKIQTGMILMAQKAGATVVAVGVSASPRKLARSWDRALIPLPFAKAAMVFGEPRKVPVELDEAQREALIAAMEEEMEVLERQAREITGEPA
jgi:lysophospholipid acyltransferase (LPLAT)-like uncharacterized protein